MPGSIVEKPFGHDLASAQHLNRVLLRKFEACKSPWRRISVCKGRGGFYDQTGTIRDVIQNHMFQVLCNLAMEPPVRMDSQSIRDIIRQGLKELSQAPVHPVGRIRRPGGGRKKARQKDPTLVADLEKLVEPTTRGHPETGLRWTCNSVRKLAEDLTQMGHRMEGGSGDRKGIRKRFACTIL
jgi:hypothetical protein